MLKKTFANRIRDERRQRGITQGQLADALGVDAATVSRYETGAREPDHAMMDKIANFFGLSTDYLIGRTDTPNAAHFVDSRVQETPAHYQYHQPTRQFMTPLVPVPIYGEVTAGPGGLAEEELLGVELEPMTDMLKGGDYFYLRVRGDSMIEEGIRPGSLVLVRLQAQVADGDIAVVVVNDEEGTVKRIRYTDNGVMLIPANRQYLPEVHKPDEVHIIGKVVKAELLFE